ncbi:sigma-70 family RNA polymerase sigma factor [Butyrivibrio sp. TB]|uniref:sigma-70 family RNA polymerase sigma factor n=1 Tax=Butyrivibrio sp. TB TaxID=1520809 RepID=UPI0008B15F5D|nr:sigma-70 family RNA polymerase sigma factor [Butyrivibrio sp. TB]SEQ69785.1 RNA polymerase sigma factor, sigma-70 family [Butyrivibrio sp. TB]
MLQSPTRLGYILWAKALVPNNIFAVDVLPTGKFSAYFEQVIRVNKCRKLHDVTSISDLQQFVNEDYNADYSYEEIQNLVMYADKYLNTASLNKVVNDADGGDTEILDFVASEQSVEDQVMDTIISEEISKLLGTLSDREHAVISMRFGLEGNYKMTLEEIGLMYNVTRERIRQIESKAIKKLALPAKRKRLEGIYA